LSREPIEFPVEGLSDGTVRLRLIGEADLPAIVAACQDREIARWTRVPDSYGDSDAREWLDVQQQGREGGSALHLLVVDARDDELLGSIGLVDIDWKDRRGSIGYWVAPGARGRAVATRAVRLLAAWGFDELGLGRVEIKSHPDNAASHRVAERAGFTREGLLRSHALIKGRRRDMIVFSLLPGEPQGRQETSAAGSAPGSAARPSTRPKKRSA
jgi:RimJ/RimL family protein N-acetyltransferase